MSRGPALMLAAAILASSCQSGPVPPAALDASAGEACRWCRMAIADIHTTGQIVAPMEDPLFFDDIGCLRDYLRGPAPSRPGAIAYVADHRTGAWVHAARAVYTRARTLDTPMGSRLIAHADPSSRDADPASAGGDAPTPEELFGPHGPPDGDER